MTYTPTIAGHEDAPTEQSVTVARNSRIEQIRTLSEKCLADAKRANVTLNIAVDAYRNLQYFTIPGVRTEEITAAFLTLYEDYPLFRDACGDYGGAGYLFSVFSAQVPVTTYSLPFPLSGVFSHHRNAVCVIDAPTSGLLAIEPDACLFINRTKYTGERLSSNIFEKNLFVNLEEVRKDLWVYSMMINAGTHEFSTPSNRVPFYSEQYIDLIDRRKPEVLREACTLRKKQIDKHPALHSFLDELVNYCRHNVHGIPARYGEGDAPAQILKQVRALIKEMDAIPKRKRVSR